MRLFSTELCIAPLAVLEKGIRPWKQRIDFCEVFLIKDRKEEANTRMSEHSISIAVRSKGSGLRLGLVSSVIHDL